MRSRVLELGVVLLVLAACRGEVHTDLNISTVTAVLSGAVQSVPATLGIEVGTRENCGKYKLPVQVALKRGFGDAVFLVCRTEKDTVFADYRVNIPVSSSARAARPLAIRADTRRGRVVVTMQRNQAQITAMTAALPRDLRSAMDGPLEPEINVRVHNDSGQKLTLSIPAAFVNGKPHQQGTDVILARGGSVRIGLSDLGNASLYGEGSLLFSWPMR